jgi:hypothetical protein
MNEQPEPSEEVENDPPAPTPKGNRIRRWERTVLLPLEVSALVAIAVWFLLPPAKPTVAAKIDISAKRLSLFGQNPLLDSDSSISPERQAARVKSRLVLNAALNDPKVVKADPAVLRDRDTLSWLEQEIKVDFPSGPEILRVSMVGDDTDELLILVDAVVDAYMNEFQNNQSSALNLRIEKLGVIYEKRKVEVRRLHSEQRVLAEIVGAGEERAIELRQARAQRFLHIEEDQLFKLREELSNRMRERRVYERISQGGVIDPSVIDKQIDSKSVMLALLEQEIDCNRLIEENKQKATGEGADRELKRKRDGLRKRIDDLREQLRPLVERELRASAQAKLLIIDEQINDVKELLANRQKTIAALEKEVRVVIKKNVDLDILKPEIKLATESLTRVATTLDALKMEQDAPPRAKKLENASVFRPDEMPRKLRFAGIGAASTFALVLLLAAYLGFRSRLI